MLTGILSTKIYLVSPISLIVSLSLLIPRPKLMIREGYSCSGHSRILHSLKKYSPANSLSLPASSVSKTPILSHVALKMELYPFMISEKNPTLQSLKIESPLINILTQFGTFSGSLKEKEAKDKPLSQSVLTVESLNGQ